MNTEKIKQKLGFAGPPGGYRRPMDFTILALVTALTIFGLVMVFSSSYYWSLNTRGTPYYFLTHQALYAVVGFVIMMTLANFDYHKLVKWTPIVMVFSLALLIMVFFVGLTVNNATRWIALGPITLMPGEIAKVAVIMFVAAFLGQKKETINRFFKGIMPAVVVTGVYAGLIIAQPNLSTAVTLVTISLGMMFLAGLKWRWILGGLGAIFAGVVGLSFSGVYSHWMTRITDFSDPFKNALGEGFQVAQSLMALGTGGLFGLGLGKSVQKNLYLPEPMNDFILSIVGEELGFVGIVILLTVFMIYIYKSFNVAMHAPDRYGLLLAGGFALMIAIQVAFNVAVITASMPPTGIALPFISYGGNALWICMGGAGVILNISRQAVYEDEEKSEAEPEPVKTRAEEAEEALRYLK